MSSEQEIFSFLKDQILEIKDINPDSLQLDSSFAGFDSLDFVSIQLTVRKHYGMNLEPELFATRQIATMRQLAAHIVRETSMPAEVAQPIEVAIEATV